MRKTAIAGLTRAIKRLDDALPDTAPQPTMAEHAAALKEKTARDMAEFHTREAEKYEARAAEREAQGKHGAAARSMKVAERNRKLAAKHAG